MRAEFYRGRLRLVAEPGTTHTYSNHGFATLGQIVEDVTGRPLADHLRDRVFAPLGMTHTDLVRSDRVRAGLATGYALRAGGPHPVGDRDVQKWFIAGAWVCVRRGRLVLRALSPVPALVRGLPLRPDDADDPYVFRIDLSELGIGTIRVVFSRSRGPRVTAFHLEFAPLSFDKRR